MPVLPKLHVHHSKGTATPPVTQAAPENPDDIDEIDGEGQNILLSLIGQLRSGSDLSRITLPTFILERKSMLERITNQLQPMSLLDEAHSGKDPVDRFLGVVKWYLSGWHIAPKAVKKPLNPVLGEHCTFYFVYDDGSVAYYIAEQTSHHPPKSSYFYIWPEKHIRVDGTLVPKSRFLGNSAASIMEGVGQLQFLDIKNAKTGKPEFYELTQPNIYARGILIGTLKFELGDHAIIKCPGNDLIADIEFKTKGFISGTYNAIQGEVKHESTGEVLYEITGKWNEIMYLRNVKTGKKSTFFDTASAKRYPPQARPIPEQGPFESRKLWEKVTNALAVRDHTVATDEKFLIEDRQRGEARKREADGVEFHPKLFKPVNSPLQFQIYKEFNDLDPQQQVDQVCSIAPILPGQEFQEQFSIPAFKKDPSHQGSPKEPPSALDTVGDLKEALPAKSKTLEDSYDEEDDDEFEDAHS